MAEMNKLATIMLVGILLLGIHSCWINIQYENLAQNYNSLAVTYNGLIDSIFRQAQPNSTAVTIIYFTNFSSNQRIATFSIPYNTYDNYHWKFHPYWGEQNLTSVREYITSNETIIKQIVEKIRNETQSEEELANALLDFVQYKGFALSIRYYPTTELKYPIETLTEMGGDCDTHSFLYATLMKAAGFKSPHFII
jgi:transglutaminase-like putative cysteine protease